MAAEAAAAARISRRVFVLPIDLDMMGFSGSNWMVLPSIVTDGAAGFQAAIGPGSARAEKRRGEEQDQNLCLAVIVCDNRPWARCGKPTVPRVQS